MSEPTRSGRFRDCRVVAKTPESRIITSFLLEPLAPETWTPFEPGQFLVIRVPASATRRQMPRSYSVSSSPAERGRYRITVKREPAPAAGLPDGAGSGWLHDEIAVGDVVSVAGPRGEFFLDQESTRPVALLSGGVGLTPMVSMLHALSAEAGSRPVHFIHACDNGEVHALRDEVLRLAAARSGIAVHFCYRFPTDADRASGHFHSDGVVTAELLASILPPGDRDYYLCGPSPFMKAVHALLRASGVARDRIRYEFFGPATVLEETPSPASPEPAAVATAQPPSRPAVTPGPSVAPPARDWLFTPPANPGLGVPIEFRKSGIVAAWDQNSASLLDFAEANGVTAPFSCRAGVCSTRITRLIEGEVVYTEEPLEPPASGAVLICCSKPHGPVVLDL